MELWQECLDTDIQYFRDEHDQIDDHGSVRDALDVVIPEHLGATGPYAVGPAESMTPGAAVLAVAEMQDEDDTTIRSAHLIGVGEVLTTTDGRAVTRFAFAMCEACRRLPAATTSDGLVACPPCRRAR